ncbi:hypothetical protein BLNAU_4262 [Blattamonas nauphoetae]|uniref:Uncharacterized protein n=1 Tax=Blattamonas nauphoetae TaxID=2049346 RepID=A0ABQ9YAS3_9EUKA|nr:hypothetical protein BLNAU_4262 [Blattamonas nauphoetae]
MEVVVKTEQTQRPLNETRTTTSAPLHFLLFPPSPQTVSDARYGIVFSRERISCGRKWDGAWKGLVPDGEYGATGHCELHSLALAIVHTRPVLLCRASQPVRQAWFSGLCELIGHLAHAVPLALSLALSRLEGLEGLDAGRGRARCWKWEG